MQIFLGFVTSLLLYSSFAVTVLFLLFGLNLLVIAFCDQDVVARLGKAGSTFSAIDRLWKSKIIGRTLKGKIFNNNVKAVLTLCI